LSTIHSGKALNVSLRELWKRQARGEVGPDAPVPAGLLGHLNVVRAGAAGDVALLRRAGRLPWPKTLQAATFEAARKRVDAALSGAAKQAKEGELRAAAVREAGQAVEGLGQELANQINELTPTQYIEARRFHKRLETTAAALADQDVRQQIKEADELAVRGRTVAKLVRYMADKGLEFAPAVEGDEASYVQLHRIFAAYADKVGAPREGK
jgi:hypothetical protein